MVECSCVLAKAAEDGCRINNLTVKYGYLSGSRLNILCLFIFFMHGKICYLFL